VLGIYEGSGNRSAGKAVSLDKHLLFGPVELFNNSLGTSSIGTEEGVKILRALLGMKGKGGKAEGEE